MVVIEQLQSQAQWLLKEQLQLLVLKPMALQLVRFASEVVVVVVSVLLELSVQPELLQLYELWELKQQRASIVTITQFIMFQACYRMERLACKLGVQIRHILIFDPCKAWLFQVSLQKAS